jgi:hypothetical protein
MNHANQDEHKGKADVQVNPVAFSQVPEGPVCPVGDPSRRCNEKNQTCDEDRHEQKTGQYRYKSP